MTEVLQAPRAFLPARAPEVFRGFGQAAQPPYVLVARLAPPTHEAKLPPQPTLWRGYPPLPPDNVARGARVFALIARPLPMGVVVRVPPVQARVAYAVALEHVTKRVMAYAIAQQVEATAIIDLAQVPRARIVVRVVTAAIIVRVV